MSKIFKFTIIFLIIVIIVGGLGFYFNFCLIPPFIKSSPVVTSPFEEKK